jgi:hypothetical protein
MKITRQKALAVVGFVASALLALAASCAFEGRTSGEPTSESKDHGELTTGTPAAGKEVAEKTFTANEFCAACHYAFGEEELAAKHEKAGIGCERCHGESERHRSDEDNVTPPEIMYPGDKINPTCMMCHPRHEIEHVGAHKKLLAGAKTIFDSDSDDDSPLVTCTFCHAKRHRMSVRTIRWNKATGELLDE